jgi:hypothetical protein
MTLPHLRQYLELGALLGSIYIVQTFDAVFVITSGGLGTANLPYAIYTIFYNAHERSSWPRSRCAPSRRCSDRTRGDERSGEATTRTTTADERRSAERRQTMSAAVRLRPGPRRRTSADPRSGGKQ